MKAWHLAALLTWTATAAAQTVYTWRLKADLDSLSVRVRNLSTKLDERPAAPEARPSALTATLVRNGADSNRLAPPPTDEHLRKLVVSELNRQDEDQRLAAEASLELAIEQTRESLARELDLSDDELAGLESLGDKLQAAESALLAQKESGRLTEATLREQHLRVWTETNSEARRLLGEAKYAKLDALRRDRPELARSLYVLRPSPVTATATLDQDSTR